MKKFNFLFLFLFTSVLSFSQAWPDSLDKKPQSVIGFGLQYVPNQWMQYDRSDSRITFKKPGYEFFYRYLIPSKTLPLVTAISTGCFYREGTGSNTTGSIDVYQKVSGSFKLVKGYIGISEYFKQNIGKRFYVNIGGGGSIGPLIYSQGALTGYNYSLASLPDAYQPRLSAVLKQYYLALNAEINVGIQLSSKYALLIGAKQSIESADGFGAKSNFTRSVFIAWCMR